MEIEMKDLIPIINDIEIIDIREVYKYNLGAIPRAKNININYLQTLPEEYLNKKKTYYLYCEYGEKSKELCDILRNKGYQVVNIKGGYNSYRLFQKKL